MQVHWHQKKWNSRQNQVAKNDFKLHEKRKKKNNPTTKNENVKWKGNGYSFISKKQLVGLSSQQSKGVKSSTFFGQRAGADNWQ